MPMTNVEGIPGVFGGSIPAEIWHDFMTAAVSRLPVRDFAIPYSPAPPAVPTTPVAPTAPPPTTTAPLPATTTSPPPTTTSPPGTTTTP
jgi:penicillin-binding protein 1A